MGWIICPKHGGGFITLSCEHVRAACDGQRDHPVATEHIQLFIDAPGERRPELVYVFCGACADKIRSQIGTTRLVGEKLWEEMESVVQTVPVCAKCFDEAVEAGVIVTKQKAAEQGG